MPSPSLSPQQAVAAQLDALKTNDEPWPNHGIQTAYEFALEAGGMDPSFYFGFRKDLYHFDHFMGMFANKLGELVDLEAYEVLAAEQHDSAVQDRAEAAELPVVRVRVTDSRGKDAGVFAFALAQRELGRKKGSWMVHSVVKEAPVPAA